MGLERLLVIVDVERLEVRLGELPAALLETDGDRRTEDGETPAQRHGPLLVQQSRAWSSKLDGSVISCASSRSLVSAEIMVPRVVATCTSLPRAFAGAESVSEASSTEGGPAAEPGGEGELFPAALQTEREVLAVDLADLEAGNALRGLPAVPRDPAN